MKIFNLYFKYFLLISTVYFILKAITGFIIYRSFNHEKLLSDTLFFGIPITLILVTYHIYKLNYTAKKFRAEIINYGAFQTENFYSNLSPIEIFENLKNKKFLDKIELQNENQILIEIGFTGKSWGDKVVVNSKKAKSRFEYKVQSKPIFPLTIIDFGQNLENVQRVKQYSKNFA